MEEEREGLTVKIWGCEKQRRGMEEGMWRKKKGSELIDS